MRTQLVDEAVWLEMRRRRGPSTWVVVVAIIVGIALVWGAFWARSTGRTSPHLTSNGMSGRYDAATSSIDFRVRVGNTGDVPLTVVGAEIVGTEGSRAPGVRSVTVTPTIVPVGSQVYEDGRSGVEVPMHVVVDCDAIDPSAPDVAPGLVLITTGTWPVHGWGPLLDVAAVRGLCDPASRDGA